MKNLEGEFYQLGKMRNEQKKELGNIPLSINANTSINDENFLRAAQLE